LSTQRLMSRDHPAGIHYQKPWTERASNPDLPDWLRVCAAAYGRHRANGHATLRAGELARVVGTVDRRTGELRPNQNISRAIRTAVEYGFLAEGSRARCLVVPSHAVAGGLGSPHDPCREHGRVSD
jgi:hypothetical protein